MALTPKNASDSLIDALSEIATVPELFFHATRRRMEYDRVPVGHDIGYRCYDGSKHSNAEEAFQSGEYGDGLSEDAAYSDWLRNVDEPPPRRTRVVYSSGPREEPPETKDLPEVDHGDERDFDTDLTDGEQR